ncbi:MAG: hypothetical protein ACLQNE_25885 [Thermoguttaceae bacterium]
MSGHIFNIQDDGTLVEMNEEPFATERKFQELLAKHPNLLAGDQIDSTSPRKWLLVQREMGVPAEEAGEDRWSLDHLFLDQDAVPTLVEVKRSSDPRVRREVVGQMLEYAANAVLFWQVEEMRARFAETCNDEGIDPETRLLDFLGKDGDSKKFWEQVKTNLQTKKIRLLFVADVIPLELRRIVEFLNAIAAPTEILAIEIRHYVGQGMKTLVPRVIGQTAEAEGKKGKGRGTLDKTKYRFEGQDLGKGRLVLSVIRKHVQTNPRTAFSSLEKSFPKELQGVYGCFATVEKAKQIWERKKRKRHFLNPEDIIELEDSKIAVCSQWGRGKENTGNIGSFVETARGLGYSIQEVGE